jgi:hypothetical protein
VRGTVQHFEDSQKHSLRILQNVMIPEADDPETARRQISIAPQIRRAFAVLTAVGLNDKPLLERNEINNPRTDRHLPAEFHVCQLS